MSAPTKDKTWNFLVNNACYSTLQTNLEHHQLAMFRIKECWKAFANYPWTCSGSSNSTTSGMDGSDRWVTSANLIWVATSGVHSWIVLRQPQISAQFEVCIDLLDTTSPRQATIVVSPSVGFGVVNGGTDGSTSLRPTATDEHVILNKADWIDDVVSAPQPMTYIHCMESNDGQCTRTYMCENNKVVGFNLFDIPKNPISAWSPKSVYAWTCSGSQLTNVFTYVNMNDLAKLYFRHSGTEGSFYCASMGQVDGCAGQRIITANDLDNQWNTDTITLFSATATRRGVWGELFDLYWGSSGLGPTNAFEDAGYSKWVQIGEAVTPWNGTLMRVG
jgi:hypothetical protein